MKKNVIYVDFIFKKKKVSYLNYYFIHKLYYIYRHFKNINSTSTISSNSYEIPVKKVQ